MSDITRSAVIEAMKKERKTALHENKKYFDYVIASLETDEAYQLEYEHPEFCEDAVSKKAILEMLVDIDNAICDGDGFQYQEWHTKIDELPSVLPKTEVCEDCVSRFEVTEILNSEYDIDKMLDRVDKLPSVLPKADKNDLGVDCIDRAELLKAMDTWDKFGNDPNEGLIRLSTPALQDRYVPYIKYEDMVNCVKDLPSVTSQKATTGHWIADVDKWGDIVTTVNGYRCDKCNTFNTDKDNYCPNCGAKMESEDNK